MNNKPEDKNLKKTVEDLKNFFSSANLVSEPVDFGDILVYPLSWYGFGFGGGGGGGGKKDAKGKTNALTESGGGGYGYGAGGAIFPFALVVVHKNVKGSGAIQVLPLESPIGQMISALVESMSPKISEAFKTLAPNMAPHQPGADIAGKITPPKQTAVSDRTKRAAKK